MIEMQQKHAIHFGSQDMSSSSKVDKLKFCLILAASQKECHRNLWPKEVIFLGSKLGTLKILDMSNVEILHVLQFFASWLILEKRKRVGLLIGQ